MICGCRRARIAAYSERMAIGLLLAAYGLGRVMSFASKARWLLIVGFLVASVVWIRRGAT
jgi:ABC-type iron transport system FetAB permease component